MAANLGSRTVKKTTGPPDHFITTYTHGVWGFQEKWSNQWEELDTGDIVLFHSTQTDTSGGRWNSGVIGYGIVGERDEKDYPLWRSEKRENENTWPLLVWFDETRWRGDIDRISTNSIEDKVEETVSNEIQALLENRLKLSTIEEELDYNFPVQSSVSGVSHEAAIIELLEEPGLASVRYRERDRPDADGQEPQTQTTVPNTTVSDDVHEQLDISIQSNRLFEGLHFPPNERRRIRSELESALESGKHVVLTGPPGTGKTEIAENLAALLQDSSLYTGYQMATATADWSTFDTVGGYMPEAEADGEQLEFTSGQVLRRFAGEGEWRNEPLVIDEINRADIDKAFGQLFTVLSGQRVQLPFKRAGREIEILPAKDVAPGDELGPHKYVMPQSWRLIATMNSYDKTSLYEMSYAFMRRFAFVRVPVPQIDQRTPGETVADYASVWDTGATEEEMRAVERIWAATNDAGREIGPALVKDILEMVTRMDSDEADITERVSRAVVAYILPQLEGIPEREEVVQDIIDTGEVRRNNLEVAANEMLNITLGD